MTCTCVRERPVGLMLVLAYVVAVPVWLLSAPMVIVLNLLE